MTSSNDRTNPLESGAALSILSVATTSHGRVLAGPLADPLRLLVGFHGYAQGAGDMMAELERIAAPAWTPVAVQALNRFYRGRSPITVASWMTREDRDVTIADNIAYVDRAVDAVAGGRQVISLIYCGFSQGVAMAFRAAVKGRRAADAVIALGGDVPPELLADPQSRFPRVIMAAGRADDWFTPARLEADAVALRERGVLVDVIAFDGGHEWHDAVREGARHLLEEIAAATPR